MPGTTAPRQPDAAQLLDALKNGGIAFVAVAGMAAVTRLPEMTIYPMIGSGELEPAWSGRSRRNRSFRPPDARLDVPATIPGQPRANPGRPGQLICSRPANRRHGTR